MALQKISYSSFHSILRNILGGGSGESFSATSSTRFLKHIL